MNKLLISVLLSILTLFLYQCKSDEEEDKSPCHNKIMGTWKQTYEKQVRPNLKGWGGSSDTTIEISLDTMPSIELLVIFEQNTAKSVYYKNGIEHSSDIDEVSYTCDEIVNKVNNESTVTIKYFLESDNILRLEYTIEIKHPDPDPNKPSENEIKYIYGVQRFVRQ